MDIPVGNSNSQGQHGFAYSPERTPVVFGSVGRGGMFHRFTADSDVDEVNSISEVSKLALEEEELLRDLGIPSSPRLIASRPLSLIPSYGALDGIDEFQGDIEEESRLIGKAWDNAVESGKVYTSYKRELVYLARAATPLTVTFLLQYSLFVASVFSVGHLGRTELGAVSLASMTANITGFALIQGLATCLDTLCAQAYGAGQFHQVGEFFQKCTVMIMALFVPIGMLWYFSRPILLSIVGDPALVDLSVKYLRIILIGIPGYISFECGKRFVQAQGIFHASTIVLAICAPVNALLNYNLVWNPTFGLGFVGAPLSVAISNWLMPTLLLLFVVFIDGRKCWGGFSWRIFQRWGVMLRLAIPGVIMVEAEFLAFEILTLASSRLGTTTLAAQSIVATTSSLLYQIPFAVGIAASTRVANFVGASLAESAKLTSNVSLTVSVLIAVVDCSVCYVFRYSIGNAFSNDEDVIELVAQTIPVIMLCHFFDVPGAILNGLLRGIGRQRVGGYLNLFLYYVIAVPLSFYLTFTKGYGLVGMWSGFLVALVTIAVSEIIYLYYCDWDVIVLEAEARQLQSQGDFA